MGLANENGPELEDLIHQLSLNDHQGPPPAANSAIDPLPSIKISKSHLSDDCCCTVCLEKFELGALALKLPCKHLYHPVCIIPWLTRHNTCSLCQKGISEHGCGDDDDGGADFCMEEGSCSSASRVQVILDGLDACSAFGCRKKILNCYADASGREEIREAEFRKEIFKEK